MEIDNNHRSTKLHTRTRSRTVSGYAPPKPVSRYDDVFNSPSLLSPSDEIYSEIFAGFRGGARGGGGASGIPFLDLPPVDENVASFDFRFFDYSEVFGGFEGMDYAVPFHELFRQSNGGYASSSDDAWTPVETECLSEEWDGSSNSPQRKSFGNESNQQSVDGSKQFNMSFQRKHPLKGVSTTANLAPVTAVPGYAVVIDQTLPSQKIELQNLQLAADGDDGKRIKRGRSEEKHSHKRTPYHETSEQAKVDVPNGSDEVYVTISEINLRTQPNDVPPPARPPPIFDVSYGNTSQATSSIRAVCSGKHFPRSVPGKDSPPFIDVEVDGRFSAADFAPMRESVKKSQATVKMIKENMQNKNVCAKDETECDAAVRECHNSFDNSQLPSEKESSCTSDSSQSSPDVMRRSLILSSSDKRKSKQSSSMQESSEAQSSGECSEAPEFIELVRSEKSKTHKQENGGNIVMQDGIMEGGKEEMRISEHGNKINKRVLLVTSNKSEAHVNSSDAMSEVASQDEKCKEVLLSLRTTHQCEEVERKAYEEDKPLEDDIFIDIMNNEHEIKKESNKFIKKLKFDEGRTEDAKHLEVIPKDSFVATEDDQKVRETCAIGLIYFKEQAHSRIPEDAQIKQPNERVMNIYVKETRESCFKEAFEDEENFKIQKKSNEKEQKEKQLLNETNRISRETSVNEENERREKEEEYVAKLMEASENEAEDMLKEALEEVNKRIIMEEVERAKRKKEMKYDAERPHDHESSDEISRSKDLKFERTVEKEPKAITKTYRGPNMMNSSQGCSYLTPDADISTEAIDHRSCKTEKIEATIRTLNSVPDSNQDNVRSAQEVIIVPGTKPNYKQISYEGKTIAEYTIGAETSELSSASKESLALPNRTSMSSNSSGEASSYKDQIGVKANHKVPHMDMGRDSKNLQKKVKVRNVTELENTHAQTKAESLDEVDIIKDKFAQKTDRGTVSNKGSVSDGRNQTYKTSQKVGGKENCRNDGSALEERTKLERGRRAREIELERLWEMEEEWERDREREKDRVAFENVARNVREGAYAGLHERASVNKATIQAEENSCSDKISMEAKMRQDPSAAKRAYAEAHERADRSVSFNTATYPSVSIYNDAGLEVESAQRCKARLERQQRTAERAAKALAEKNTRDVIAQREQAERHRLAESLDAEVKRWANGKQGNLRALLSTLQYILGADSGWQPIPLTDIITSFAVKKAYRKATLCVHPDKLQQRRATIQEKYRCEKVFDLLKEAWNTFNSEER